MKSEIKNILDFLGEENEKKIKDALTDAIIKNLEESVSAEYFISSASLQELLDEAFIKILKKYKKEITDSLEQRILALIRDFNKGDTNNGNREK